MIYCINLRIINLIENNSRIYRIITITIRNQVNKESKEPIIYKVTIKMLIKNNKFRISLHIILHNIKITIINHLSRFLDVQAQLHQAKDSIKDCHNNLIQRGVQIILYPRKNSIKVMRNNKDY